MSELTNGGHITLPRSNLDIQSIEPIIYDQIDIYTPSMLTVKLPIRCLSVYIKKNQQILFFKPCKHYIYNDRFRFCSPLFTILNIAKFKIV